MCGIVAVRHDWLVERGIDPAAAVVASLERLRWRGPDGSGCVHAGGWWLGATRLAIGARRSRQPVVRRGARFAGVFNGAVTDAANVWRHLGVRAGERRPLPNDAWLPLLAVTANDATALTTMRGHHAYAVVDAAAGALVFGQDRHGEKPLLCVVARRGDRLELVALASTPAALAPFCRVPAIGPRRAAEWFRRGFHDAKPAHVDARLLLAPVPERGRPLVARPGDGESWWRPWGNSRRSAPATVPNDSSGLRRRITEAVARCAATTEPVGLALSGGLDSSCLALALRDVGRVVPAFQVRAQGHDETERLAAVAVAARAKLELCPIDVGPELCDHLERLTRCAGAPLGDPSILAAHALGLAASERGVRVLLGGEGADELLMGYRRYRALQWLSRWPARWFPKLGHPSLFGWSMRYASRLWRAWFAPDPAAALLAVTPPAFGREVLAKPLHERRIWNDLPPAGEPPARTALDARNRDLEGYLVRDLLPKIDIAWMAAAVEGRCPYLEARLPESGETGCTLGKRDLRRAFGHDLPTEVLSLPKRGFALPLDRWFRGQLPWLDLLAEPRTRQRPHLQPGGVARAVDRHRSGRADLGHGLYLLAAFEVYLRCIDRGPSDESRA